MPRGIYKRTKETKRKMSEVHKEIGSGKWMLGRKFSKETRKRMSIAQTGTKKPWSANTPRPWFRNKLGEQSWPWKGGITPIQTRIRNCLKYKNWRKQIFIRDKYTCQICKEKGGKLHADHYLIKFSIIINSLKKWVGKEKLYESAMKFEPLWDLNNGRVLCKPCHKLTPNYSNKIN